MLNDKTDALHRAIEARSLTQWTQALAVGSLDLFDHQVAGLLPLQRLAESSWQESDKIKALCACINKIETICATEIDRDLFLKPISHSTQEDFIRCMIDIFVNDRNHEGEQKTPLHLSLTVGHFNFSRLLMNLGANSTLTDLNFIHSQPKKWFQTQLRQYKASAQPIEGLPTIMLGYDTPSMAQNLKLLLFSQLAYRLTPSEFITWSHQHLSDFTNYRFQILESFWLPNRDELRLLFNPKNINPPKAPPVDAFCPQAQWQAQSEETPVDDNSRLYGVKRYV